MDSRREYVLRTVEERGVRLVRLWFTDVLGKLKSFAISPAELENAFDEGMHFDGSAIDGFSRIQESDVLARPDPSSFELLPWNEEGGPTARMFCDIANPDGSPFDGDPHQVLKRNLDRARELGFSFYVAPEMEFFYFADGDPSHPPVPLDSGSYFDLTVVDAATDLRKRTIHTLEAMGIPVEYSFHEDSPSQHEIDLRYTDALSMADNVMTMRLIVREIAQERGFHATFMPKPLEGLQGSGMHTHVSLFEGDRNAFHDADDPHQLSKVGRHFIAGLLRHAREMTCVTNQLVNSYKRLIVGSGSGSQTVFEAPVHVSWGRNNRSALVRVPVTKNDKESSTRVEYRAPDPACNPYLAFSVILAAGLAGIEGEYDLPPESAENLFAMTSKEREAEGIQSLPASLLEAIEEMEGSSLVRDCLGEHICDWFLRNKRSEWQDYKAQVTPFELERYLTSW
ncbi:MAG TPA: glutamine synthetase family protein [Acidimicrobiales bacterium]|nr:glutamine synthetase family protein [Acidimicrobiales bacterium]